MEYLEKRVRQQQNWYEQKATLNKRRFLTYQTIIITLSAIIPSIVAFSGIGNFKEFVGPVSAVISTIIAIIAGLDKLTQPQPNWFNFRANEEAIKKEEWLFRYKAGPYRGIKPKVAEILFVERIESIISADIARITNLKEEAEKRDESDVDESEENVFNSFSETENNVAVKPKNSANSAN